MAPTPIYRIAQRRPSLRLHARRRLSVIAGGAGLLVAAAAALGRGLPLGGRTPAGATAQPASPSGGAPTVLALIASTRAPATGVAVAHSPTSGPTTTASPQPTPAGPVAAGTIAAAQTPPENAFSLAPAAAASLSATPAPVIVTPTIAQPVETDTQVSIATPSIGMRLATAGPAPQVMQPTPAATPAPAAVAGPPIRVLVPG